MRVFPLLRVLWYNRIGWTQLWLAPLSEGKGTSCPPDTQVQRPVVSGWALTILMKVSQSIFQRRLIKIARDLTWSVRRCRLQSVGYLQSRGLFPPLTRKIVQHLCLSLARTFLQCLWLIYRQTHPPCDMPVTPASWSSKKDPLNPLMNASVSMSRKPCLCYRQ